MTAPAHPDRSSSQDILEMSVADFLEAIASRNPTPGGGSVAAIAAALGAALGRMSLAFSKGKRSLAAHAAAHEQYAIRLARTAAMASQLAAEDIQAFGLYQQAQEMPDGPDRQQAARGALAAAINVPRELAKLSLALLGDLNDLADKTTPWLLSDLKAGAALAVAAVRICEYNVQTNAAGLDDATAAQELVTAAAADVRRADQLLATLEQTARPM